VQLAGVALVPRSGRAGLRRAAIAPRVEMVCREPKISSALRRRDPHSFPLCGDHERLRPSLSLANLGHGCLLPSRPRSPSVRKVRRAVDPVPGESDRTGSPSGSRRGPVSDRATTRNDPVAWERKHRAHERDGSDAAGQRTGLCNLAKVGVAGSNPVVRSRETCADLQPPFRLPRGGTR
jgi:hypothetical protein